MNISPRKSIYPLTVLLALSLFHSTPLRAQPTPDLQDEDQRVAYALGVSIGQNLMRQQVIGNIDMDAFLAGMRDVAEGDPRLSRAEIMGILQAYQERLQMEGEALRKENLAASEAFLADNATRRGVTVLESGLQYEVLKSGPAGPTAGLNNSVLAHYHGTLADGSVFDSSVERGQPAEFGVTQVIAGWTEALQLMKAGDKWRLYIPPDMAYGENPPTPAIPPNSMLIFEVEVLQIN